MKNIVDYFSTYAEIPWINSIFTDYPNFPKYTAFHYSILFS